MGLVWIKNGVGVSKPHALDCPGTIGEATCGGCNGPGRWAWAPEQAEPISGLERAVNDSTQLLETVYRQRGSKDDRDYRDVFDSLAEAIEFLMRSEVDDLHEEWKSRGVYRGPKSGSGTFKPETKSGRSGYSPGNISGMARGLARAFLRDTWKRLRSGKLT